MIVPLFAVQIEGDKRRRVWWAPLWGVLAITSLAMALFAASFYRGRERDLAQELAAARDELRAQTLELTKLTEAFGVINGPDTVVVRFGQAQAQVPGGKVFVNPAQGVALVVSNLPAPPAGKLYQMWLLPHRGMPVPAGLFQPAMDETALHIRRGPVDVSGTAAVAVTLESADGAPQPSSQPLILARLDTRR
jgi:hypothetical protein